MTSWMVALAIASAAVPTISAGETKPSTTTVAGPSIDEEQRPAREAAFALVKAGQPAEALARIGPVIAAYEAAYAGEKRRLYCGMSMTETIAYMGLAAKDKADAMALGPGYCDALYLKGYALIDLKQIDAAREMYRKVIALAPFHAHFLSEYGQSFRLTADWSTMLATCREAEGYAGLDNPADVQRETILAKHCQGYARSEQHDYDGAEALYRECLKLDPTDTFSTNELSWIADQRLKTS